MADPATQFQPAGIQPSGYTPTVVPTQTRSIQLANYAPMMQAIEQAGQNIMNSPLNPEVRSRMQLASASAQAQIGNIQQLSKEGLLPFITTSAGGQAQLDFSRIANLPVTAQQQIMAKLGLGGISNNPGGTNQNPGGTNQNPQQPAATTQQPADNTTQQPATNITNQQPATNNQPVTQGSPGNYIESMRKQPTDTDVTVGKKPSADIPNYFGNVASNAPAAPGGNQLQQPMQDAQGNVTGNYVASTDNNQLLTNYFQQKQQDQQKQQQLTQWQNQNVHPVVDAQTALGIYKRFNTNAVSASYLPNSGPGGSPAINFGIKMPGGGHTTTMVPVDQLAKMGGGGDIATLNPSHVFNAADQQTQQQQRGVPYQNAPAYTGGAQQQPGSGSPTPMTAQLGGPPAAPSGEPAATTAVNQTSSTVPRKADGSVDWQQLPGQLSDADFMKEVAATTGLPGKTPLSGYSADVDAAGNPITGDAYVQNATKSDKLPQGISRDMIDQALVNQRNGTGPQGLPNPNSRDPNNKDQFLNQFGDYTWYTDAQTGIPYTARPGEDLTTEKRLYEGDPNNGWKDYVIPRLVQEAKAIEWNPAIANEVHSYSDAKLHDVLEDLNYQKNILPVQQQTRIPPESLANLNTLQDEIVKGRRVLNALPDNVTATDLKNNAETRLGEGQWKWPPIGTNAMGADWDTLGKIIHTGKVNSDPKLNFAQDQMGEFKKAAAARGENVDDIISGAGGGNYKQKLENYLFDKENAFQRGVSATQVAGYRIPGFLLDTSHAIHQGNPIYDPADKYGPGKFEQPGANAKAYSRSESGGNVPNATPAPTPPLHGEGSKAQAIKIAHPSQTAGLKNVYIRDSKGNLGFIDNEGKARRVSE